MPDVGAQQNMQQCKQGPIGYGSGEILITQSMQMPINVASLEVCCLVHWFRACKAHKVCEADHHYRGTERTNTVTPADILMACTKF